MENTLPQTGINPEPWKDGGACGCRRLRPHDRNEGHRSGAAEALLKLEFKGKQHRNCKGSAT